MTPEDEEKTLILIPTSSLSPWLYPVFLSFYFVSDFSPPKKGCPKKEPIRAH
jgi:hypothetical protein